MASSATKLLGPATLLRYHFRNALYFNLKNGPWYIKILVWPWSVLILLKQFVKIVIGKERDISKSIIAGVLDFYNNSYGRIETKN